MLTSTSAVLGQPLVLTVDIDEADVRYDHACSFGYIDLAGNAWFKLPLAAAAGTSLLCIDANGSGDVIMGSLTRENSTGLVTYTLAVPNNPALLSFQMTAQACVADLCATGSTPPSCPAPPTSEKIPIRVTNALDFMFLP